ncbi:MAG: HD domain-containing protein [Spirochaetes bacterium]|nr:HD domain-containing protein [Spirochaetota bacterium]
MLFDNRIKDLINNLSKSGKIFFYGSTAYFKYRRAPIKLYRILTDINIAKISQYINKIKFSKFLDFDCHAVFDDNILITFLTEDIPIEDDYSYLKAVYGKNKNIFFNFFYQPIKDKFFILNNDFINSIKNKKFSSSYLGILSLENIIDYSYILSEMDINIEKNNPDYEIKDNYKPDNKDFSEKIKSLLPFIEMVLTGKNPYNSLIFLNKTGLLDSIFPFLKLLKGIKQDRFLHPEGDVFDHTIHCFQNIKNPSLRLSYGLLMHDLGKLETKQNNGFHGHSMIGSKKVKSILSPLGYDREFIKDVEFLVQYHMVNSYFFNFTDNEKSNFFNNELGLDLLKLFKADLLGSIGRLDSYLDIISDLKKVQKKSFKNKLIEEIKYLNSWSGVK